MRYNVNCSKCGRTFVAETEKYGTMKYRCPYCSNVLTCKFDAPEPFRTRARSVIPLADATPVVAKRHEKLPNVKPSLISTPSKEKLAEMRQRLAEASQQMLNVSIQAGETLKSATVSTSEFVTKSSSRLQRFQEKYEDGDLWIFFGFSLLFILLVFVGLVLCAEIVKLIAEGHSWMFKNYIELKNMML
ncbi:MAG: hypothetical protein K6A82_03230 [Prevotella sp.]|nr:hypothetical protein [Prevotella sp.]